MAYTVFTNFTTHFRKEDFENAQVKKSKTLDIEKFVEETKIADMLFKNPYYLEPQKEGGKAYRLLRDVLKKHVNWMEQPSSCANSIREYREFIYTRSR